MTPDGFQFPSEYVGQYGAFEALKHIYSRNEHLKHLVRGDSLFLSRLNSGIEIEQGVQSIGAAFRQKHGIPEDAHVAFFAPGNETSEVVFCMDAVRKGVKEF